MKFRKKPVEIEAIQWNGTVDGANAIIEWILLEGGSATMGVTIVGGHTIAITTLEGTMRALPGDWVIQGVQGEFYPCKPDIFEATYEAVSE